jgi:hypothetical protein
MNVLNYNALGQPLFVEQIVFHEEALLAPPSVALPFGETGTSFTLVLPDDFPAQNIDNYYVKNGVLTPLPPKPEPYMEFDYAMEQWVDRRSVAQISYLAVNQRNALLASSDWTQLPDVPLDTKTAWATYRQALRDITDQPGYPFNIVWPTPPSTS